MKNILLLSLLSLLIAFTGCKQLPGGDIDFGDVTIDNSIVYGDSIVTVNGTIVYGDYTGPVWSNWQYWDQSSQSWSQVTNITTMIDNSITVGNNGYYAPGGSWVYWEVGQLVYDQSENRIMNFNGTYWNVQGDVNSGNWYYDQSTNTFTKVINKDESTTITNIDNSIYINGSQYNGNVVYDHRDQSTYTYWNNGGVWFNGDGNTYSYDNSTYSWVFEYKSVNLCPAPCQTDTLCPKDTVFQTITIMTTVTDTIYSTDTVVIVLPTGSHYVKVTSRESQADRDNNRLVTGGETLRGSSDTTRTFLPINKSMGIYAKVVETSYDATNGSGTYYAASPISGDSVAFSVAPRNGFSLNSVLANAGGGNVLLGKALTFNFSHISANLDLPNPSLGEWGTFLDNNHDFRVMYCVQTPELEANYPSETAGFALLPFGSVYENYGVGQAHPSRFVTVQ